MSVEPVSTRLKLPSAYGAPADSPLLDWSSVVDRLNQAEHYWSSTADQNGAPIARPLDGVWLDGAFYFGGDPATRWRRNLAKNPRACLSIDDTTNPVILEGSVAVESLDENDAELTWTVGITHANAIVNRSLFDQKINTNSMGYPVT